MDEISFLSLSEIQDTADNAKDTVGKHHDPGNGSGACAEKARERTRDSAKSARDCNDSGNGIPPLFLIFITQTRCKALNTANNQKNNNNVTNAPNQRKASSTPPFAPMTIVRIALKKQEYPRCNRCNSSTD